MKKPPPKKKPAPPEPRWSRVPRWRMPCVWVSVLLVIGASAIHAGVIPPARLPLAAWLLAIVGTVGSLLFPGLREYQAPVEPPPSPPEKP